MAVRGEGLLRLLLPDSLRSACKSIEPQFMLVPRVRESLMGILLILKWR